MDINELTTKLYQSRQWDPATNAITYDSEMVQLVRQLHEAAEARDLTLSRWESNRGLLAKRITYALHTGERKDQFRYMDDDAVIDHVFLSGAEGTTRRCAAYKELARMFDRLVQDAHPDDFEDIG